MELQHYDKVVFIEQPEHIYDSVIGRNGFIVDINDDLIDVWVHFEEEERSDTITEVESSCVKFLSHTSKASIVTGKQIGRAHV